MDVTRQRVEDGPAAGKALAYAGDLLRRRDALAVSSAEIMRALGQVDERAAHAFVAALDATAEHTKLARGLEDAFEGILEEGQERVLFQQAAEAALLARDALESVRVAMTERGLDTAALDAKLAEVDGRLAKNARVLVGLNAARRRELSVLDASERERAWWFSARVGCDFLMSLYQVADDPSVRVTAKHNAAHLATCEACQGDVEAGALGYTPQHIPASSLWRRENGVATSSEVVFMEAHAKKCKDCRRVLDAFAMDVRDE